MGFISFLEDHLLSCKWKEMGMECLGCGLQRSVVHLLKGEFVDAFLRYPAIYTLMLMFMFLGLHLKFNFSHGHRVLKWLFILNMIIIVVNYVFKIS